MITINNNLLLNKITQIKYIGLFSSRICLFKLNNMSFARIKKNNNFNVQMAYTKATVMFANFYIKIK